MDTYAAQQRVRLMVVEDEVPISDLLQYGLSKEGFQVACTHTAGAAIVMAAEFHPQIILLDWMLPDMDGLELCRILSAEYNVPIIMLTARSDMEDKLKGLESGADDYITKPFDMREVAGRVRAVLRRFEKAHQAEGGPVIEPTVDDAALCVSEKERVVMQKGRLVELTPKEYELLCYLLKHPREALSRQVLLEQVWGYDFAGDTRTVDIHIQRLRKKMTLDGHLLTVFGVGYKYVP
ncbi:MAG: response regulator transcription factor [Lachnospiraceae bacterium]|nr:response regulator transcription factor [Lachnospiraceae bacterium]